MGWLHLFPCFASRETRESETIVAPSRLRAQSILSQDGYGTMSMTVDGGAGAASRGTTTTHAGLSNQQRERMSEIQRVAGSHMRPIDNLILGRRSQYNAGYRSGATGGATLGLREGRDSLSPSPQSSRTSSPSPPRPESSPPDGIMRSSRSCSGASNASGVVGPDGVVRKSIFDAGGLPMPRRVSSGGSGRKGKGKRRATGPSSTRPSAPAA